MRQLRARFGPYVDDVTLDKFNALQERPDLAALATLLRLQEHAPSLPSAAELSEIVGSDVANHQHIAMVAARYEFDGVQRLRFEHATSREAADLLLGDQEAKGFQPLRAMAGAAASGEWLPRAISVWQGQQFLERGDWTGFKALPEQVRTGLAADMLSLTDNLAQAEVELDSLDYDAWTAQDLAYELVAGFEEWPTTTLAPVMSIITKLLDNAPADGAYALFEALLYIRSKGVAPLWDLVDQSLERLAQEGTPLARQLLLSVDALAWRPPPEWRSLGSWAQRVLEDLEPQSPDWALVRFLAGYHHDGIRYLNATCGGVMNALVVRDKGVHWTAEQLELAKWLVQWHFVHQCRARAQLARQPWIDQQFLCRSFHPVQPEAEADLQSARLISSLGADGDDQGWGFFLGENLRAVAPQSYGTMSRAASLQSLENASAGDKGLLAAVLTYSVDSAASAAVHAHFRNEVAVGRLMDALVSGLAVNGDRLIEPRFAYRRPLASIYATCGLEWEALKEGLPRDHLLDGEGRFDVEGLLRRLRMAADSHDYSLDVVYGAVLEDVVTRATRGDLRVLTVGDRRSLHHDGPSPGEGPLSVYTRLLTGAVNTMISMEGMGALGDNG
jgi:hypothetical protein